MTINCTYFNKFKRSDTIKNIKNIFYDKTSYYLEKKIFSLCGRIFRKRYMGKASFLELNDNTDKIQLYLSEKFLSNYKEIISYIKMGDIIGVKGFLFKTKTNELSLKIIKIIVLSKMLKNFPDKRFGIIEKELKYRQRYLDLMVNEETKKIFIFRSNLISKIRDFFKNKNFLEVETPIIQNMPGGADAEPFKTYHNYLNSNLYFRISPELYLKKLIVGGFEKVFEIGKNFRNESVSKNHHPEFTMIEFYQAYANYQDLILLTEELFKYLILHFFKKDTITYNGIELNFSKKFDQINFFDAIFKYTNDLSTKNITDEIFLKNFLTKNKIEIENITTLEDLQCKIFDNFVEKNLTKPTFVLHYPKNISPLARSLDKNINITERFELYICNKEIANGFSELNDPFEQKQRFKKQIEKKNNNETIDEDYINALNYGLPPTAGEGIGLDRLIMLFTNSNSIKDVILFPFMRDK